MNDEDDLRDRQRQTLGGVKAQRTGPYTAKDFQLEVLGQLAEMQAVTEALDQAFRNQIRASHEQSNLLRFDGRTLVAIGAIALSMTGYVLQDARNSSRRDAEIETTKAMVTNMALIEQANTEGRIRTQVQIVDLREGQVEIKAMMQEHENVSKKPAAKK